MDGTVTSSQSSPCSKDHKKIPIMKDGMATCLRCNNVGVKDTFYGKGKQYCSANCVRGLPPPSSSRSTPLFKIPANELSFNSSSSTSAPLSTSVSASILTSSSSSISTLTSTSTSTSLSFNTVTHLTTPTFTVTSKNNSLINTSSSVQAKENLQSDLSQDNIDLSVNELNSSFNFKSNQIESNFNLKQSNNLNEKESVEKKTLESKTTTMNNNSSKKKLNFCNSSPKTNTPKYLLNTFNWLKFLEKTSSPISSASVPSFKHCPLADVWDNVISVGLKVEIKNKDVSLPKNTDYKQDFYWIASVIEVAGYFILLRYEGFDTDSLNDFWVNIFTDQIHPVGWCASQGNILVPPRLVAEKYGDWKATLVKRLTGSRTLPENFYEQLQENIKSRFRVGMRLEVVDKRRISAVRVAVIDKIIGGRLHLKYEGEDETDTGFWCHEQSPLIHPIGWAQVIGHELKATREYARKSLEKTIDKKFDENDADWDLFPIARAFPVISNYEQNFKEGMKLEAIDPLNLSTICVATVTKVLRNNYLMVGIDGMMAVDGSDWFCYHVTSPNIFPVGFCMLNDIPLTPPRGYLKKFDWFTYLKETQSIAAPVHLFKKDIPNHGFNQGMYLEAVDLMVPRLVCVATITKVVGRLLRIHFNGWDETYDQWCDCESPELYPIGWCELVGYPLEPPKDSKSGDLSGLLSPTLSRSFDSLKKKRNNYKGRYKKRRKSCYSGSSDFGSPSSSGRPSLDKASTSDNFKSDTYLLPTSFNNCDWLSSSNVNSKESSSLSLSQTSEMSNSSVIVKPSPVQPFFSESTNHKFLDDPKHWSVTEVCHFLRVNDCGAYCQSFWNKKIDGSTLLTLTRDDILELTCKKLGPSLKIFALIQSIKGNKK